MASKSYGSNTNWSNEEAYLNNIIKNGSSGNKAWASNQLKNLSEAKKQYNNNTSTNKSTYNNNTLTNLPNYNPGGTTVSNLPNSKPNSTTVSNLPNSKPNNSLTTSSNIINHQYGGNSYEIDLSKDYSTAMEDAVKNNDYALAAQLESQRNAKINYLNGINRNTFGATETNNYGAFKSVLDLPSNWSSAIVDGNTYTRDDSGKMYNETGNYLGDGYNSRTNEFTISDENDAANVMYSALKKEHGLEDYTDDEAIAYLQSQGLLNRNLLNAYMTGSVGDYNSMVAEQKKNDEEYYAMLAQIEEQQRLQQQQYQEDLLKREEEMKKWLEEIEKQNLLNKNNKKAYTDSILRKLYRNFIY